MQMINVTGFDRVYIFHMVETMTFLNFIMLLLNIGLQTKENLIISIVRNIGIIKKKKVFLLKNCHVNSVCYLPFLCKYF